jgi:hypothetical protein
MLGSNPLLKFGNLENLAIWLCLPAFPSAVLCAKIQSAR